MLKCYLIKNFLNINYKKGFTFAAFFLSQFADNRKDAFTLAVRLFHVTLFCLHYPLAEVEGNELGHPEPVTETQYKKSSFHFSHNKEGARMLQPINNPVRPLTLTLSHRARENKASLSKGGGTEVPEGFPLFFVGKRKAAFTLAEVLITLGIIGIVAAMTLPALIQKNNNRIVETRLQKFYSSINQAVQIAEFEYGDKSYWFEDLASVEYDKDGNLVAGECPAAKWFNKYLGKHMKVIKTTYDSSNRPIFYFPDGSALMIRLADTTRDYVFFTKDPAKCDMNEDAGRCAFLFIFVPNRYDSQSKWHDGKGFEPYKWNWDGTKESLYADCGPGTQYSRYCAALIQNNGWKIPPL